VEVGINFVPRSNLDVHATQNCYFYARALQESGVKEVVPQIEVGLNSHVGLTQGHKDRYVQDPRGDQVVQFQAIELQLKAEKSV
jgi:hypothetical protein